MSRWELEKVAAAHVLEALKVSLDHLRDFSMSGQAPEMGSARSPSSTYAQVRRLRTYVQRCVSAYSDRVELDLNEEDQNLLAACAVFEIANLDRRLGGPTRALANELEWLEERRKTLAQWAVAFATQKIEHIPVADEAVFLTTTVQAVLREIQRRVVIQHQRSGVHRTTHETAGAPSLPGASSPAGAAPRARAPAPAPAAPPRLLHDVENGYQPAAARAPGPGPVSSGIREFGIPAPPQGAAAADALEYAAPTVRPVYPAPGAAAPQPTADPPPAHGLDLDPRTLQDPRLRAILTLDLRAFERAMDAADYRMCAVHLGSILEAACIDFALARRRELALGGAPETWSLEPIIGFLLGGEVSSMERAFLFHLAAARNLLRPAIQLTNPMVVTAATHAELLQFVRRILALMGYLGSAQPHAPAGSGAPLVAGTRAAPGFRGV